MFVYTFVNYIKRKCILVQSRQKNCHHHHESFNVHEQIFTLSFGKAEVDDTLVVMLMYFIKDQ